MHESRALAIGVTSHDTDPEGLKLRRFAGTNDCFIRSTMSESAAIYLCIGQPLGSGPAIGAQQSEDSRVDMKAPTVVVVDGSKPKPNVQVAADGKKVVCESAQVRQQVFEIRRIQRLAMQQCGHIVFERRPRCRMASVRKSG